MSLCIGGRDLVGGFGCALVILEVVRAGCQSGCRLSGIAPPGSVFTCSAPPQNVGGHEEPRCHQGQPGPLDQCMSELREVGGNARWLSSPCEAEVMQLPNPRRVLSSVRCLERRCSDVQRTDRAVRLADAYHGRPICERKLTSEGLVLGPSLPVRQSGIGKEFARQIAASGIHVALVGRREPLLRTVGAECTRASGVEHRIIPLDVSEPDFLSVLADATRDLDVGVVVSNAGTGNPGEFLKLDRQLLQATLRLNTMAHLDITHHFGAKLAQRRRDGLILVGAMGAENGIPCMANDGAAKAYVHSLGEALHYEFKPSRCLRHCTGSRVYEHTGARKVRPRSEDHVDESDERRAVRF
jgi:NADP-dependent 3-hydroxy acid dehydrogenase YdfG